MAPFAEIKKFSVFTNTSRPVKVGVVNSNQDDDFSAWTQAYALTFSFFLLLIILSRPLKAPEATNRMFVVSTCTVSPRSFREFFSGTFTIVPSSNFNKP